MIKIKLLQSVDDDYLRWINDHDVTRYLNTKSATYDQLLKYVSFMIKSPKHFLFGIYNETGQHVGNITLNNIENNQADIGLLIGKEHWNKGYGTEALKQVIAYAFNTLGLKRVWANCNLKNVSALKIFKKAGFKPFVLDMELIKPAY